jgi:hypothetical protein
LFFIRKTSQVPVGVFNNLDFVVMNGGFYVVMGRKCGKIFLEFDDFDLEILLLSL